MNRTDTKDQAQFTFGNAPAEVTLLKILREKQDKGLSSFVTKFLGRISELLHNIKFKHESREDKQFLYMALRARVDADILNSVALKRNPEVTTYLKNAAIKRLRTYLVRK